MNEVIDLLIVVIQIRSSEISFFEMSNVWFIEEIKKCLRYIEMQRVNPVN